MNKNHHLLEKKIAELQRQTKSYLTEIKQRLETHHSTEKTSMISYFTYSLNISHDSEIESICLGSYHIKNIGNRAITNPYICIKIPKDSPFSFTGKYIYKSASKKVQNPGGWERLNDKEDKAEFWLKPLEQQSIEPGETVSFSNFQIKWKPEETYRGSIMGYTYSAQMPEGIAVINPINLSGVVRILKEEEEVD